MEYSTSGTEIKRRKLAYVSLSLSLIAGTCISSAIYQVATPIPVYLVISISLLLLGAFSFYFFKKISTIKINISSNSLQRKFAHSVEEYPLVKINKVKIKWTTQHSIREIYIFLNDEKKVFLTGLIDFEGFRTELLAKLEKQTTVQEWREPINFDSVWFYPILGVLISNLSVLAFKSILLLNYHQIKIGMWLFGGYLCIFGVYFILATPISKRSGNATKQQDYVMGMFMLLAGIFIVLVKQGGF